MILLIHGNDIESSRNYYFEEKNKLQNSVLLEGEGLTYDLVFQAAENNSLFGNKNTILIENFFTKNKLNSIEAKKIIEYINLSKNTDAIFWEETELTKPAQFSLKKAEIKMFSYPQVLFTFLDNLKPNNSSLSIKLFQELKKTMELEIIFFMMIRQFRLMLNAIDTREKIDDLKRLAPWQLSKLERQARSFSEEKLKKLYKQMFEIDLNQKTGKIPYSLERSIDFFLLDL